MGSRQNFSGQPDLRVCPGCGVEQPVQLLRTHVCDPWRWIDHQVDLRREELERFERELGAYLGSARGRFELWYAERERAQGM